MWGCVMHGEWCWHDYSKQWHWQEACSNTCSAQRLRCRWCSPTYLLCPCVSRTHLDTHLPMVVICHQSDNVRTATDWQVLSCPNCHVCVAYRTSTPVSCKQHQSDGYSCNSSTAALCLTGRLHLLVLLAGHQLQCDSNRGATRCHRSKYGQGLGCSWRTCYNGTRQWGGICSRKVGPSFGKLL